MLKLKKYVLYRHHPPPPTITTAEYRDVRLRAERRPSYGGAVQRIHPEGLGQVEDARCQPLPDGRSIFKDVFSHEGGEQRRMRD